MCPLLLYSFGLTTCCLVLHIRLTLHVAQTIMCSFDNLILIKLLLHEDVDIIFHYFFSVWLVGMLSIWMANALIEDGAGMFWVTAALFCSFPLICFLVCVDKSEEDLKIYLIWSWTVAAATHVTHAQGFSHYLIILSLIHIWRCRRRG